MEDDLYTKFIDRFIDFANDSGFINKDYLNDKPYQETKKLFNSKITHVGVFVEDIIDIWFPLLAKYNYDYKNCHDPMIFGIDKEIATILYESGCKFKE